MAEITARIDRPARMRQVASKSWAFAREAPLIPMLILVSVLFLALVADLLPLHDPEVSVKDEVTGRPIDH